MGKLRVPVKIEGKHVGDGWVDSPAVTVDAKDDTDFKLDVGAFGPWYAGLTPAEQESVVSAWVYGAKLHAGQPVRKTALASMEPEDHRILMGRKSTDLDALPFGDALTVVNTIRVAVASGLDAGERNIAKAEHFARVAVESGRAVDAGGVLKVKGNGGSTGKGK